jgi:hypothetical protein
MKLFATRAHQQHAGTSRTQGAGETLSWVRLRTRRRSNFQVGDKPSSDVNERIGLLSTLSFQLVVIGQWKR